MIVDANEYLNRRVAERAARAGRPPENDDERAPTDPLTLIVMAALTPSRQAGDRHRG